MALSNQPDFPPLLSSGFCDMTFSELRDLCVTRFPNSISRPLIMAGLEKVISGLSEALIPAEVWLDGSFLTEKIEPVDSDIVVKVECQFVETCGPVQYEVLKVISGNLRTSHLCDSYVFCEYPSGHSQFWEGQWITAYWIKQFGFDRAGQMKGIARIRTP